MPHCSRADVVAHSLLSHYMFRDGSIEVHSLRGNMRASNDPEFAAYLLLLGDGQVEVEPNVGDNAIRLPDIITTPEAWEQKDLLMHVYPDLVARVLACAEPGGVNVDTDFFKTRAILSPTNKIVNALNDVALDALKDNGAHVTVYTSTDTIQGATANDYINYPIDFLHSLEMAGLPPHELRLTPGSIIILLRNLDASLGLVNGARCTVKRCQPRFIDVLVLTGRAAGERVYIPRIPMAPKKAELPFILCRRQFPVRLAWAMTINKAQGQSLERVGVALPDPVFSHGQLYVALSRAGSFERVTVLVSKTEKQGHFQGDEDVPDGVYTDNIVWPEALYGSTSTRVCSGLRTSEEQLLTLESAGDEDEKHDTDITHPCVGMPEQTTAEDAEAEALRDVTSEAIADSVVPTAEASVITDTHQQYYQALALLKQMDPEEIEYLVLANSDMVNDFLDDLNIKILPDENICAVLLEFRCQSDLGEPEVLIVPNCTEGTEAQKQSGKEADILLDVMTRSDPEMIILLSSLQTPYHVTRGDPGPANGRQMNVIAGSSSRTPRRPKTSPRQPHSNPKQLPNKGTNKPTQLFPNNRFNNPYHRTSFL